MFDCENKQQFLDQEISRREFLKKAAIGAAGVTTWYVLGGRASLLRAAPPVIPAGTVNAATPGALEKVAPPLNNGWHEISTPGHLLFMGANWGKGQLPRDGKYRLMNDIDMEGVAGFVPIGTKKENNFKGEFDGGYHIVYNLKVYMPNTKYVGFFGYIGEETEDSHVCNLGLINIDVTGTQNVGTFVGVSYGFIEHCFATGKVYGDAGSNGNAIGGFAGKNKGGEETVIGRFYNCYFYGDVLAESYSVSGMIGKEEGGEVLNSWSYGTLTAKDENGSVGGMAGSFNAGNSFKYSVSMATVLTGARNTDKICGQQDDETGDAVIGNLAWDGARIVGNEPAEQYFKWRDASSADLQKKATYTKLGWDFNKEWLWHGSAGKGFPVLRGFSEPAQAAVITIDLTVTQVVINSAPVNSAKAGKPIPVTAKFILPAGVKVSSAEVFYEYGPRNDTPGFSIDGRAFTKSIALKAKGGAYTGNIPPSSSDYVYYYVKVNTPGSAVTKPFDVSETIRIAIDNGSIDAMPANIVMNVSRTADTRALNWVTGAGVGKSVARYWEKANPQSTLKEVTGTSAISAIKDGFKERESHKAALAGLKPNTAYQYQVGDGQTMSEVIEFSTDNLGQGGFTFLFTADPQSVEYEDFMTATNTITYAQGIAESEKSPLAFALMAGDITQDGYKSTQWNAFFRAMNGIFAKCPLAPLVGNHDVKGDPSGIMFRRYFNLPANGPAYKGHTASPPSTDGSVYSFEYGDVFFAVLNSEVINDSELEPFVKAQLAWLEQQIAATKAKWRVVFVHFGPYTSNHNPEHIKALCLSTFDRLKIDMVLNGHDHNYIRVTAKADKKVPIGQGTTYVTGGTIGNKFYEYLPRTDQWVSAHRDEFDQQIFSLVTVKPDGITLRAYQKADPKDKKFSKFNMIDSFTIPRPLA